MKIGKHYFILGLYELMNTVRYERWMTTLAGLVIGCWGDDRSPLACD